MQKRSITGNKTKTWYEHNKTPKHNVGTTNKLNLYGLINIKK